MTGKPYYESSKLRLLHGDVIDCLREMADESVQCVVTSPPYWGLRDYGIPAQLGLEETPELYVQKMVEIFREVRRVLRRDGTCWVNLGDSYASAFACDRRNIIGEGSPKGCDRPNRLVGGLKEKDQCLIPHRVALALQADGWWVRSTIVWSKPNPMPESCTDRPTTAHEYVFLLTKSARYYYDTESVREGYSDSYSQDPRHDTGSTDKNMKDGYAEALAQNPKHLHRMFDKPIGTGRNKRTVWTIPTQAYPAAHFATYPEKLVEPCVLAGTSERGACAACGSPWERCVEKESSPRDYDSPVRRGNEAGWQPGQGNVGLRPDHKSFSKTTGWRATCECDADTVPCVVCDPFSGSGTSGLVALRLGRHYVGIDLNSEYLDMSLKRMESVLAQEVLAL